MKIECLLKRPNGTQVPFDLEGGGQVVYHFKPVDTDNADSPHVADVDDDEHIARFLSIKDGYRLFKQRPGGSLSRPPQAGGGKAKGGDKENAGQSGGSSGGADESNANAGAGNPPPPDDGLDKLDVVELMKLVEERTGRAPNPNTKREKLVAQLRAAAK